MATNNDLIELLKNDENFSLSDLQDENKRNILVLKSIVQLQERMGNMEEYIDFLTKKVFQNEKDLLEMLISNEHIPESDRNILHNKIMKNIEFIQNMTLNEFKKEMENATPDDLDKINN